MGQVKREIFKKVIEALEKEKINLETIRDFLLQLHLDQPIDLNKLQECEDIIELYLTQNNNMLAKYE